MPDESIPGPTPTGYKRTQGGGVKWVPPSAEHLSKLLPQYDIECILGYGGMGAVYKGKQKSLDRTVAIKILPPGLEDEDFSYVDRFKNEAKVMAKFIHPAIVAVHDFGETGEGQLYIVMEFVDGTDVQKMLHAQGRLPSEHALAITAHVCDALKYAHDHGVIHRDIKPANILINMEGAVKVADFGLAKAEEAGASGLTKSGMAMGTPDFVAPETLVMGVNVDGRADLYAVGVMLYNMLTGNVPRGAFKPASVQVPGTDPRFDKIVQKAMQMDRDERYQSALEIRRDLDVILTTPLVQAGGKSSAAIPKQSLPQKPMAKGPQQPQKKATAAPNQKAEIGKQNSKAPLFIGLAATAAVAVAAFFMSSRKADVSSASQAGLNPATQTDSKSALPIKVREELKPAESTQPATATSSVKASGDGLKPGTTYPPGKWVKVFTKLEDLPPIGRAEMVMRDGWLDCTAGSVTPILTAPASKGRNQGIRVRMKISDTISDTFGSMVSVRCQPTPNGDGAEYRLNLQALTTKPHVVVHFFDRATRKIEPLIPNRPIEDAKPGTEHVMELFAVGEKIIGRFDGKLLPVITNSRLTQGEMALQSKHLIRDIEVINLDGIPEAEALKILGVDEKGNDLRAAQVGRAVPSPPPTALGGPSALPSPAISASPSLPISKSSEKFTPGQWVKVFTKFEDLPADLRQPDSGVKFEDGWIKRKTSIRGAIPLISQMLTNYGVRARFIRGNKDESHANIDVRCPPRQGYFDRITLDASGLLHAARFELGRSSTTIFTSNLAAPVLPGKQYTMEVAVVGQRVIGRSDNSVASIGSIAQYEAGRTFLNGFEDVRDIEVINLDGIPEAEALRILGVDEKGNDTRAAALAAEKLAMEQKQVAQAAASIPELATLDEQLKKLTAERVSAPFEAEVAKLNSGYLGGLDRKRAEEKAAGHLDSVLAIEAEKKLITGQQPIPSAEDDATSTTTPAALKGLRQIYRDAYAKIEATRTANLKALTDPLTTRLKLLESDLTKKDRIADAKTVKEYREGLSSTSFPTRDPIPGGAAATMTEADKNVRSTSALKDGFTNSLGMKFVPVKGTDVLFCIHETRYKDYAAYAAEAQGVDGSWRNQSADGFIATGNLADHPVWNVNWEDAQAFCAWLSKKEGRLYRLPTDEEWSIAVGLGNKEKRPKGTTPALLSEKENTEFPWDGDFPPKTKDKAGNYSDASRKVKAPRDAAQYLEDYDDGFPTTAPVMNFKPNKFGLYDLGGNVWEWTEDWADVAQKDRVLRGGSWDVPGRARLLSSNRLRYLPGNRYIDHGFRVVVETRSPNPAITKPVIPTPPQSVVPPPPAPATAAKSDFSNSLGMKFVKVPGTQVLFCIHETRRQDYAAYAAEVPDVNGEWKNQQRGGIPVGDKDDHPVVAVNWDDANAFSAWLSKKEGRKYRLPTDKEWSFAVGIGREEKWSKDTTPEMLNGKVPNEYPWGGDYPPKTNDRAGNYVDTATKEKFPTQPSLEGYTDGFAATAPVMSFKPNKLGLYDMGGNACEWVDEWWNAAQKERVLRGSSFDNFDSGNLLSSRRFLRPPADRINGNGFRIVVEMTAP